MFNRFTLLWQKLFVLLAITSVLTGCVGQVYAIGESKKRAAEAASSAETGQPAVTFTLKTGFAGGRPKVEEIMAYFPALIPKSLIETKVEVMEA